LKLGHSFEGLQLDASDFIAAINGMLEARRHSFNIRDYFEEAYRVLFGPEHRPPKANARGRKAPDKIEE
jgi:hypothetical protein